MLGGLVRQRASAPLQTVNGVQIFSPLAPAYSLIAKKAVDLKELEKLKKKYLEPGPAPNGHMTMRTLAGR